MRKGTKAGREQSVRVFDPFIIRVLRELRRITDLNERIVPLSLGAYNSNIYEACIVMGLGVQGFSGHSARAGFATHLYLKEGSAALPKIRDICRWQSEKTLKVYLDVVGATASAHSRELEKHASVADEAEATMNKALLGALKSL